MKSAALAVAVALSVAAGHALALKPSKTPEVPPPTDADWRTPDPQNTLVIDTNQGRIIVELQPAAAPQTVAQVLKLARTGVYDGRKVFRVIDGFMDQTGDPVDSGVGGSSLPNLKAEFTFRRGAQTPFVSAGRSGSLEQGFVGSLPVLSQPSGLALLTADGKVETWGAYCPGVVGMARAEDPDSANSQFFLMRDAGAGDGGNHALDKHYTAIGRAIAGQDVIDKIKTGEPVPEPMDKMLSVKVLADLPEGARPVIRVIDPAGAWFKAEIERQKARRGADFSVCQIALPVVIK